VTVVTEPRRYLLYARGWKHRELGVGNSSGGRMRKRMQMRPGQVSLSLLMAGFVLAGLGCSGEDLEAPTTGILEITTATAGAEPDTDGYVVTVDDGPQTVIGATATFQLQNVESGDHSVQLAGIAENCAVAGENPRSIQVDAGKTARLDFVVTCVAAAGTIQVAVTTSGSATDPDGYVAKLDDGEPGLPVASNGNVTFGGVAAGSHTVTLTEVAADCAVTGGPVQSVTVAAGETSELAFEVTCALPAGSIQVTTATTGSSLDPDGYTVSVDAGTPQAIGPNATLAFEGLAVGTHSVALAGIAGNCHLDGDNPRTVEVPQGSTTVTFEVTCLGADALIAFTSNAFQLLAILVVNPDGTGLRNLTPDGVFESDPVWSPDGRKILFIREGSLYVMEADGSGRMKLADGQAISEHRWSPDGRMIAFVDIRQAGEDVIEDLWVIQADGTGQVRVTENGFNFSWSPDGRLVYTSDADLGDVHLRIVNPDGTGSARLTSRAAFQPAWSPDGTRIAFVSLDAKDLFLINPDGSGETNLTQGLSENDAPSWSPDGSRIAFGTAPPDPGPDMEIAVINRDGSGQVILTHPPGFDFQPVWSPDGTKIVFTRSEPSGDSEIHVMNADGSNQINVSNRPETLETGPDWNGQGGTVTAASRPSAFYQRWLRANHVEAARLHH
jgi:Tol biopolymer transport system component